MAVLDAPARGRAMNDGVDRGRRSPGGSSLRRDPVPDLREDFSRRSRFTDAGNPDNRNPGRRATDANPSPREPVRSRRAPGWRLKLGGSVPGSLVGRVAAGFAVLLGFGVIAYGLHEAQSSLMHDARLTIPSSRAIEISGNQHLTRAQLLSVFGEDVDRNIMTVPLANRQLELQALPWVEHATVMRLLPNRVSINIVERTPVAFVRQGNNIGLIDAHGVLLDMAPDADALQKYSFPVVTGFSAAEPASTRAARMKRYQQFMADLDAGPDKVSQKLSEVDLTDPDDIKALLTGESVLVHFGDQDFLARYQRFEQNLAEWKTKYPKLASADMQYPQQVVLEMAPGSTVTSAGTDGTAIAAPPASKLPKKPAAKLPAKAATNVAKKPVVITHAKAASAKPARGPR